MIMLNNVMELIIKNAEKVETDIPVCAAIVQSGEIISLEVNEKEKNAMATHHAEILAINAANKKLKRWRLDDCDLYVTLEPCPMCAWAIITARIKNVYFGSYDLKYGALGSVLNLSVLAKSKINVKGGIKETECNKLLEKCFEKIRYEKNS